MCKSCKFFDGEVKYDFLHHFDFDTVEAVVLKCYRGSEVTSKQLRGPVRHPLVAHVRGVLIFALREFTQMSFDDIGARLGGRHHTTVLAACQKIAHVYVTDLKVRNEIDIVLRAVHESVPVQFCFPFVMGEVAHA